MALKTWRMKRNCSLTPKQLSWFYAGLISFSLSVGGGFWVAGVWVVPIFTALEVTAVTIGFLMYSRHALDFEEIRIEGAVITVTKFIGFNQRSYVFSAGLTVLTAPRNNSKVFVLSDASQTVEIGQFVPRDQLRFLIADLKAHLR